MKFIVPAVLTDLEPHSDHLGNQDSDGDGDTHGDGDGDSFYSSFPPGDSRRGPNSTVHDEELPL